VQESFRPRKEPATIRNWVRMKGRLDGMGLPFEESRLRGK
jgi:hypothetical protein